MEGGADGMPEGAPQEMHEGGWQAHQPAYLDPAHAQALANFMPEFADMDPATQAAAMQHYEQKASPQQQQPAGQPHGPQSETESDMEEGVDAGESRCLSQPSPCRGWQRLRGGCWRPTCPPTHGVCHSPLQPSTGSP
jgi:hypothetical protein